MDDTILVGSGTARREEPGECETGSAPSKKKLGGVAVFIILAKINWGIGMMAMPYYFHCAGIWFGLIFFVLSMALAADASICLTWCRDSIPRCAETTTYAELVRSLLGRPGESAVIFSLTLANWGSTVAFIKFIGDNLARFLPEAELPGSAWALAITVPLLFCSFVDDVRPLERFSTVGLLAGQTFAALLIGQAAIYWREMPAYVAAHGVMNWSLAPVAMGLAVFCNEGMVIMTPPVHAAMRRPAGFTSALTLMIIYFTVNYMLVAASGDLVYGYVAQRTVKSEISLSFQKTLLHRVAVYFYILQLLMTIPSVIFAFYSSLEAAWLPNATPLKRRSLRVMLILCAGLVAVSIPHFGDFLAVTGGVGNSIGIYILPHLCILRANANRELKLAHVRRATSWIIVAVFGVACGLLATIVSVEQLFRPSEA